MLFYTIIVILYNVILFMHFYMFTSLASCSECLSTIENNLSSFINSFSSFSHLVMTAGQ